VWLHAARTAGDPTPTPTATATPVATPVMKNIVETAVADGRFTTLVAAVQAAGLADTLSGTGPFTVFAPTDDAFKKLPAGTVETLLKDPQGQLKADPPLPRGEWKGDGRRRGEIDSVKTVQGQNVTITTTTKA